VPPVDDDRIQVGMLGAGGRMGGRIITLLQETPGVRLAAALERPGHPRLGEDAGTVAGIAPLGLPLVAGLPAPGTHLDVLIDFSSPESSLAAARWCVEHVTALVVGTTGFEPHQRRELEAAAHQIPLLIASNFSVAVNLLFRLVGVAAKAIGAQADIEVVERHHHFKKDAPSGTALTLAETAAQAIGTHQFVHGRHGVTGERPKGEIGLHALRTGDNPGEHTVVFGLMGECLELSHRALNRDGFARGAIDVARWIAGKPAGRYTMDDFLG
jgi:4-hydroxy-tetrahydrodipicolinate reductase